MSSNNEDYERVPQTSLDEVSNNHDEKEFIEKSYQKRFLSRFKIPLIILILALSITTNVFLLGFHTSNYFRQPQFHVKSKYAHLERNIPKAMPQITEWTSDNLTAVSELWEGWNGDKGVVALHDDYVQEMGLPRALRYPSNDKYGVYLLQSFHNMHCLRTIFRYIKYTEEKSDKRIAYQHVLHCLDQLRQDVQCNADDTPRWAHYDGTPGTGEGQIKMCKDWNALAKWGLQHTACFEHKDGFREPLKNRFKSCHVGVEVPKGQEWKGGI